MKIAICTPVYADPARLHTHCLAQLLIYTAKARPDLDLAYLSTSQHLIPGRNALAKGALEEEADYLLWIDADMTFPADGLIRLLAHGHPVVGCNCPTRNAPVKPTASRIVGQRFDLVYPDRAMIAAGFVEPVGHLGFGFCLVSADVTRRVGEVPFRPHPKNPHGLGEDVQFFRDVRGLGEVVYLDHALSEEIGHVGQTVHWLNSIDVPKVTRGNVGAVTARHAPLLK